MLKGSTVAAGHPLTAEAAVHALRCGGNAFDAALAGWLAACLAEPVLTSPGGGGFAMVRPASGRPRVYDFFTQTPLRPNPDDASYPLEADFGSTRQVFHLGPGTVATPGCVAGLLRMHADHGSLPLAECAAPAMDLSRNGLRITAHAAKLLEVVTALYTATPEAQALFASRDNPRRCLAEGDRFHNPAFGEFLDMLVKEGARWFYEGDIGRVVEATCIENGGHLRRDDFINYKAEIREPLEIRRNGATIWLNPPPSMGGTLIALGLSLREPRQPAPYPFRRQDDWLHWIEPLRLMSLIRSTAGIAELNQDERLLIRNAVEDSPHLEAAIDTLLPHALPHIREQGTTQISVIDSAGNEISMTTSNGAGSAIILPGTGFMLNNTLGEEDLQPEGPGTWQPDIRLASMMSPALAHLADGTLVATGSGGSNRIRSTLLQIIRQLVDRGASLEEAVEAPRLHWENRTLHAEDPAFPFLADTCRTAAWELVGHAVPNLFFGGAHSVARLPGGNLTGIGDPRRGGVCRSL
jgi:gamma-glutamyltranspeptidase/glutathione hydrolase